MIKDKDVLLKKANLILQDAKLQSSDMRLWENKLESSSVEIVSLFLDTFENDIELLKMATGNLKKKIGAVENSEKIKNLIQEEKEVLEKYLNE